jgi:hypothetical protein
MLGHENAVEFYRTSAVEYLLERTFDRPGPASVRQVLKYTA